ncbi:MAG: hypothetical protein ACLR5T_03440 [Veillonella sp.]
MISITIEITPQYYLVALPKDEISTHVTVGDALYKSLMVSTHRRR